MKCARISFLLVAATAASCHKTDSDSVVVVNVTPGNAVTGITQLQADISLGTLSTAENFPAQNGATPVVFPASFSLTIPRARQGTISVVVTGVNAGGTPVAAGADSKDLAVGGDTTLSITLQLPVVDKKDAGADAGRDAQPDVDRRDGPGTGGAIAPDVPPATGGTTGSGGSTAMDVRPGTGGAGGSTTIDGPRGTGGTTTIDAAIDASNDTAIDGVGSPDGGSTVRTLFDFATGTQGWTFNTYQPVDDAGSPVAPINLAVTRVPGVAAPTIGWDGTVGDPPGSLKVTASFNNYDQQVDPVVSYGSIVQDWSNKEISVRFKIDPATTTSVPQAGVQLMASDSSWKPLSRLFPLPTDNAWHTYVLDLNGASGIDTTKIAQLAVQLWTGAAPASGGAFAPTSYRAYIDTIRIDDIPPAVTFQDGQAQGAMTGYTFVAFGVADTVSSPTCGGVPMSSTTPCTTSTTWSSPNALCLTGSIPPLPSSPTSTDFANNWGISVGVNANPNGAPLGRAFSTVAFAATGTPLTGLRAQVHLQGDDAQTNYCLDTSANRTLNLASFNSICWDNSGRFLSLADVSNVDSVTLQVVSKDVPIAVTDLCVTQITFGN